MVRKLQPLHRQTACHQTITFRKPTSRLTSSRVMLFHNRDIVAKPFEQLARTAKTRFVGGVRTIRPRAFDPEFLQGSFDSTLYFLFSKMRNSHLAVLFLNNIPDSSIVAVGGSHRHQPRPPRRPPSQRRRQNISHHSQQSPCSPSSSHQAPPSTQPSARRAAHDRPSQPSRSRPGRPHRSCPQAAHQPRS